VADQAKHQVVIDPVDQATCGACRHRFDPAPAAPMSRSACPECGQALTVPGKIGPFLLVKQIGAGAMGTVFKGIDPALGRAVAIKVIPRQEKDSEELLNFLAEARALAAVTHANVVLVHTIGQHRGQPYIVMELVDGPEQLADRLARGEPLDETAALRMAADVARGLGRVAQLNLVHGDIKPQNILLAEDGVAKVVDFGLVQRSRQSDGEQIWGTPYYLAPERARGQAADLRADIYSLGATLWHLLAAQPPFTGRTVMHVIKSRLKGPVPDLRPHRPDVSNPTIDLLQRMMAIDPEDRPDDYGQLLAEIEGIQRQRQQPTGGVESIAEAARQAHAPQPAARPAPRTATRSRTAARGEGRYARTTKVEPRRPALLTPQRIAVTMLAVVLVLVAVLVSQALQAGGASKFTDDFTGPGLHPTWQPTGDYRFEATGGLRLRAAANDIAAQISRRVGDGRFVATLQLDPLQWNASLNNELTLEFDHRRGNRLILRLAKAGGEGAALYCRHEVAGRIAAEGAVPLGRDHRRLTLQVGWEQNPGGWTVQWAGEAGRLRPHSLSPISASYPSDPSSQCVITASAEGESGNFEVGLKRFHIGPP